MKLLSCHIENFGKLSNFNYNFNSKLNVINEENGFGKTTFADFIKAMFYGLETKRNTKVLIDRKKYEPWQGGSFGGSIEFETNNRKYKVERFFGKKEAEDSIKIFDLSTNLETNDFTCNVGEEIFKLNKEAFERSTFISGQHIETSMNDSISAKLGNILENENDINTSDDAIKVLDEAIKNYKKTGDRGEINQKKIYRTNLEKKIEQIKIDENSLNLRKEKYESINRNLNEKKKLEESYRQELSEIINEETKKSKVDQYNLLKLNAENTYNKITEFNLKITTDTEIKDEQEINENKIKNLKEKMILIEKNIKKKKSINAIFCITFIFIMLISIVAFIKKNIFFGVVLLVLGFINLVIIVKNIINLNKNKKSSLNKKQEISNIEHMNEMLCVLQNKKDDENKEELLKLQIEYETNLKYIENYEKENNIDELLTYIDDKKQKRSKDEIEKDIKNLINEINLLTDEKNYTRNQIEILENNLDSKFDIENELDELNENIATMEKKCEILEKTRDYLIKAKEIFSSKYLNNMQKYFINNLNLISDKKMNANIDVNLDVKINELGSNKDLKYFSTGYKDLIYICMRLSLIQALFKEEKTFIILDDPFANLDENKIVNAMKLIKKMSEDYQIIYFICHSSRS